MRSKPHSSCPIWRTFASPRCWRFARSNYLNGWADRITRMLATNGRELNYSSDVDVVFVYSEEGHVFNHPPRRSSRTEKALTNHQYIKRLVEAVVAELSRSTPEGMLYRVDLRLRPEGEAGPLARSLPSYETFYSQWGQTWERMMLIKSRGVTGDEALANEFQEMIQPFRFPRSI